MCKGLKDVNDIAVVPGVGVLMVSTNDMSLELVDSSVHKEM